MSEVKVSIITVCYNSEKTIAKTIESVIAQTYSNVEYIIIDGASKDSTMEIVESYKDAFVKRYKNEIKVVSEPDNGIYDAMNKGIRMATGKIIGIINSDDFYETDALEKVVKVFNDNHVNPMTIYYGANRALSDGKEVSIDFHNADFLEKSMISHPASFITKATYEGVGLYDTSFKSVADYDFMLKAKKGEKVSFVPIYEILANFTLGGMCSTALAYEELLDLKVKYGMRTLRSVQWEKFKGRCSAFVRRIIRK